MRIKSSLLLLCVLAVTLFSFSGCKKCYSCTFSKTDTRDFCSKDFPDGTGGLKLTIDAYQAQGYKCVAK